MFRQSGITSQIVDSGALSPAQGDALAERLIGVHERVFEGVSRADFRSYVIAPKADLSLVSVYSDRDAQVIGYCSIQRKDLELSCGPVRILRGAMGFLPEHRGKTLGALFVAWHVVRETLSAWLGGRRCYIFAAPVGPAMFVALTRALSEMWPYPQREVPAQSQRLMEELAQFYGMEPAHSGSAGCRKVGWVLRMTPEERRALQGSQRPELQFYLRSNPGFGEGDGLVILAPLHLKNLLSGLWRTLKTRLPRRAASHRTPNTRTMQ